MPMEDYDNIRTSRWGNVSMEEKHLRDMSVRKFTRPQQFVLLDVSELTSAVNITVQCLYQHKVPLMQSK